MTKIPDDVVAELLDAILEADKYAGKFDALRAALRVGMEWEREQIRRIAKTAWLTTSTGTIGDAEYGEALCAEIEAAICARKDK